MKREARVLLSSCHENLCIGVIARGSRVDGVVSGCGCDGLCRDAADRGYTGELRYSRGECSCGFPPPPARDPWWDSYLGAVRSGWDWLKHYKPLAPSPCGQGDG